MMKRYIKPEIEYCEMDADCMQIQITTTEADKDYNGGGDAKQGNTFNFIGSDDE